MLQYIRTANAQQLAADGLAASSWGATGFAWLAQVNEVLQFAALLVAIISGIAAIRYHTKNGKKG